MLKKSIILADAAILLAGCSTISKDSCIVGSWESLGYEDGRKGESRGRFNKIAKSCAKHGILANAADYRSGYDAGVTQYCSYDKGLTHGKSGNSVKTECREINSTAYLAGYKEGVPLYCSYDRGFNHGEAGNSIKNQCSAINAIPYLDGHEEGLVVYALNQEYEALYDVYEDKLAALEDVANRLSNSDMSDSEQSRLRRKLRRLERDLDETRIDIRAFERVQGWPKRSLPKPDYGHDPS